MKGKNYQSSHDRITIYKKGEIVMSDNKIIDDGMPPPPATTWTQQDKEQVALLLAELDVMLVRPDGRMSKTGTLMQESLSEVCNPLLNPEQDRRTFWYPIAMAKNRCRTSLQPGSTTLPSRRVSVLVTTLSNGTILRTPRQG